MNEESSKQTRPVIRLRRRNIPDDELLADLRRVAQSLGKESASYADYDSAGRFSRKTLEKRFRSWTAALTAAGLKRGFEKIDDEESLFENLLEVWTKLGRQPNYAEMRRPLSRWSTKPYERRFGSWNQTLIAFARFIDVEVEDQPVTEVSQERRPDSAPKSPRFPNLRLRWKVLNRDCFKCKCGRSPAIDTSVVLHVDHVIAWSNGGETVLENLQTLCDRCNLGKGAM